MATETTAQDIVQQDKPLDTEKCLADFFKNDVLTDMTLVNPSTKGNTK